MQSTTPLFFTLCRPFIKWNAFRVNQLNDIKLNMNYDDDRRISYVNMFSQHLCLITEDQTLQRSPVLCDSSSYNPFTSQSTLEINTQYMCT